MKKFNLDEIINQYDGDDFGFTAEAEEDITAFLSDREQHKAKMAELEKLIIPFLTRLLKTADQPIIKWPNRKPVIEAQIQKILNLTRGE